MKNIMEQPKGADNKKEALEREFQENRRKMEELEVELEKLEARNREIYPEITGAPVFERSSPEEEIS